MPNRLVSVDDDLRLPAPVAARLPRPATTAILPLDIPTYDHKPGVGHPDVLHVPGGWNGWEYWMAFTPLPGTFRENPSIVVSHDGITWQVPTGLTNPLFDVGDANAAGYEYWADTDLLLSHDGTTLLLYFKGQVTGGIVEHVRTTSTDGVNWTPLQVVVPNSQSAHMSPSIIAEPGGGFTMFETNGTIFRRTSTDGVTWTDPTPAESRPTLASQYNIWHNDVVKVDGVYHALVNGITTATTAMTDPFRLFYWTSTDGLNWTAETTEPAVPLTGGRFDRRGHYRSSLQPAASGRPGHFDVWACCMDDTRPTGTHTAGMWRLALYRDLSFINSTQWSAFAEPPKVGDGDPIQGDSVYFTSDQIRPYEGAPVLQQFQNSVVWGVTTLDYLSVTAPPLPKTWHRFAVDILLANTHGTLGNVVFSGYVTMTAGGAPIVDNYQAPEAVVEMPPAGESKWATLLSGEVDPMLDLRHDVMTAVRIRRRGGDTYGSTNKVGVAAVRFRRI